MPEPASMPPQPLALVRSAFGGGRGTGPPRGKYDRAAPESAWLAGLISVRTPSRELSAWKACVTHGSRHTSSVALRRLTVALHALLEACRNPMRACGAAGRGGSQWPPRSEASSPHPWIDDTSRDPSDTSSLLRTSSLHDRRPPSAEQTRHRDTTTARAHCCNGQRNLRTPGNRLAD